MSNTRKKGTAEGLGNNVAHTDADPAPEAGMSADQFNLPDNVIQTGIAKYSQRDQDDLMWVAGYTRKELGNSRERICEQIDCDWSTLFKVLCGKYEAGIENFMGKVRDLRRRIADDMSAGFVHTVVTQKIFDYLDYALAGDVDGGHVVLIAGHTGRSKTHAVREWCRHNNHGRSVYVDSPESGGLRTFLLEIAGDTGVNRKRNTADLRSRIVDCFNRRRILLCDEILRMVPKETNTVPVCMEFIRRLHDRTGCALALVATTEAIERMNAPAVRGYFEQLFGRISDPLFLPDQVRRDEARAICTAFAKRPSEEMIDLALKIGNGIGRLRVLFEDLRKAKAFAVKRGEELTAKHLQIAHARRQQRNQWPEDK